MRRTCAPRAVVRPSATSPTPTLATRFRTRPVPPSSISTRAPRRRILAFASDARGKTAVAGSSLAPGDPASPTRSRPPRQVGGVTGRSGPRSERPTGGPPGRPAGQGAVVRGASSAAISPRCRATTRGGADAAQRGMPACARPGVYVPRRRASEARRRPFSKSPQLANPSSSAFTNSGRAWPRAARGSPADASARARPRGRVRAAASVRRAWAGEWRKARSCWSTTCCPRLAIASGSSRSRGAWRCGVCADLILDARGTVEINARLAGPDPRASSRVFTGLNTDLEHIKTCEAG